MPCDVLCVGDHWLELPQYVCQVYYEALPSRRQSAHSRDATVWRGTYYCSCDCACTIATKLLHLNKYMQDEAMQHKQLVRMLGSLWYLGAGEV